jgi:hypothetical protein
VYLDHLDFGRHSVSLPLFSRIKVWQGDMIDKFSSLDRCMSSEGKKYGCRPVKDIHETCYYRH